MMIKISKYVKQETDKIIIKEKLNEKDYVTHDSKINLFIKYFFKDVNCSWEHQDYYNNEFKYNFIKHYYTYSMGLETPEIFRIEMENIMWLQQEVIDGWLRSVDSDLPIYNNYNLKTTQNSKSKTNNKSDSSGNGENTTTLEDVFRDLPQTKLNNPSQNNDFASTMKNVGQKDTTKSETGSTSSGNGESENISITEGKLSSVSYSKMLVEYRGNLTSINLLVMELFRPLMLGIYLG